MEKRLFTSESVTEGHPDKVCDAISDAILDACMAKDPMSRVACETATCTGFVLVTGEGKALSECAQKFFEYITSSEAAGLISAAGAVAAN